MNKILQKIGAGLLIAALVLAWQSLTWFALGALILVGLVDLFLVFENKTTISQWIHQLFGKKTDIGIMIGLLVYTWHIFGGPASFVIMLIGVIMGHLFWNE